MKQTKTDKERLSDIEFRVSKLEEKWCGTDKYTISKRDKYIYLHQLLSQEKKEYSKTDIYFILNKKYRITPSSFDFFWRILHRLDNNFNECETGGRAFKIYKKGTEAYIEPLDAIY